MPSVYLAGPISGLTYEESKDWRDIAHHDLTSHGISAFCPMRGKESLRSEGILFGSYENDPMITARAIMTRDHFDCQRCDVVLCNLQGALRVSIGTTMEIAWAFAYRKPLVVIMEPEGNVHDHPMVTEALAYRVGDLGAALAIVKSILLP